MRIVMSLDSRAGKVDWQSAKLEETDAPVTSEDWQTWLRKEPDHVWLMISLLELEFSRPGIPSYEDVLRFVLEEVPQLACAFVGSHSNPVRRAIERRLGARLGAASRGKNNLDWGTQPNDEFVGHWIAARLEHPKAHWNPHTFKEFNRRRSIQGALAQIYPALALKVLKAVRKGNPSELSLRTDWLTSDNLLEILKALRAKPTHLDAVMRLAVEQGTDHGLDAIANLLGDKKVGDAAVFWLACSGHRGLSAAQARWSQAKGASARAANARIEEIRAQPLGSPRTSGPRFRIPSDLGAWEPAESTATGDAEPDLTRAKLTEMCRSDAPPAARGDLSPREWADYLQVTSMDALLTHPGPMWDRARDAGWLGRGADPASLTAAARRLDPNGRIHWNTTSPLRWGELFLWADADRTTYVGAVALSLRHARLRQTVGWIDTQFAVPLRNADVSWRDEIIDWLDRIRQARPLLGTVDERAHGDVEWKATRHALLAEVPPGERATLNLGEQKITLVPAEGTMALEGPIQGERRFPATTRPLPVAVTRTNTGLAFSFGSVTWAELAVSTDKCRAIGLRGVELRKERQPHWTALEWLLRGNASGAAELAEMEDREAARLLALVAKLRPSCVPNATRAALTELGQHGAPYRSTLGIDAAPPTIPTRSYAKVLQALDKRTGAKRQNGAGWTWSAGHGVVRRGFVGPALRWLDGDQLPAAETIPLLAMECPLYPRRADMDGVRTRDALGMREVAWRLVPENGGFGNGPLFYELHAACWPVEDGFALAIWSGYDVPAPHWLMGVPFVPARPWNDT